MDNSFLSTAVSEESQESNGIDGIIFSLEAKFNSLTYQMKNIKEAAAENKNQIEARIKNLEQNKYYLPSAMGEGREIQKSSRA